MVEYEEEKDLAFVDGIRFRRDKMTGYYLSGHRINGKRVRLHVYVWEKLNGKTPDGYHIHHKDGNKYNNEPENLELKMAFDHLSLHAKQQTPEHRAKFHVAGIEAAKEWHASGKGHEWHKAHYEKMKAVLYKKHTVSCAYCGKKFETSTHKERYFCCNAHKSASRRERGVDNVEKICPVCGKTFRANKYLNQRTCSKSCGRTLAHQIRKGKIYSSCGAR